MQTPARGVVRSTQPMSFTQEAEVAVAALEAAQALVRRIYASHFAVDWKGVGDPVTQADREANAVIVAALKAAFPHDVICAEEGEEGDNREAATRGGRCWFVDPLDGTREFVDRNGEFCIMLGLAVDGVATFGAIAIPETGRFVLGDPSRGLRVRDGDGNWHPLAAPVPAAHAPLRAVVSRSHPNPAVLDVLKEAGVNTLRPCGSVGLKVERVLSGEAEVYLHLGRGPKLWDTCAPEALARAAGLSVTRADGQALSYQTAALGVDDGFLVARPALAETVLRALESKRAL